MEHINTEGVAHVGELNTRVFREAEVEQDYTNAHVAGAAAAFTRVAQWCQERIMAAGPYDDTRALAELVNWTADRIREVHSTNQERASA